MAVKYGKIILAGGSGQLGAAMARQLAPVSEGIVILSRQPGNRSGNITTAVWDGRNPGPWCAELEGAELLVNLAGRSVNCRHTARNRELILRSRTDSVKALAQAAARCSRPPALWIQASSVAIYDHSLYRAMNERDATDGKGFMADVSREWESCFTKETSRLSGVRTVILRLGVVLGKTEGVLPRLKALVRLGLGGHAGHGKQYMSWIHEDDVARLVEWLLEKKEVNGPLNAVSPEPLTNHNFMRTLRRQIGMPVGLPAPVFGVKMGAFLIGTDAGLVLDSLWALPGRAQDLGFGFSYPSLQTALEELLHKE